MLKEFTSSQYCTAQQDLIELLYFPVWMVCLHFLEFFSLREKYRPYLLYGMTCYTFRPASRISPNGKIMCVSITCACKQRIPRKQNHKTFTDHSSTVPNSSICQILPHTMLIIPQNHLTLRLKHLKFLKAQQKYRKHWLFTNSSL